MARANKKGRSRSSPFVMLEHYLLKSEAWKSLGSAARAIFVQIQLRYNGSNNGTIGYSIRCARDECRIASNTASKALKELEAKGFIENTRRGTFTQKLRRASEWLLTDHQDDRTHQVAKKTFMRVTIHKSVSK